MIEKDTEKWELEGLNSYSPKDAHQKSDGGQWGKTPRAQFSALRACEGQDKIIFGIKFLVYLHGIFFETIHLIIIIVRDFILTTEIMNDG